MCMTGTPIKQLLNNEQDVNSNIYGSRSPLIRNYDGQSISRLPTYSEQTFASREQRQLNGAEEVDPDRPRIMFPGSQVSTVPGPVTRFDTDHVPVLRECWPNPYQAESPGCSVQKYRGNWYNICR